MKLIFSLLLLFSFFRVDAQFARVEDKDGYVNVRRTAGTAGAVEGKVLSGDIVFCMEKEGEWQLVDYYSKNDIVSGYIHGSRLKMMDSLSSLKYTKYGKDSIVFRNASLQVAINCKPFIPKDNKLEYRQKGNPYTLYKINHRIFWGTDGEIPSLQYKQIACSWQGKQIIVPDSAICDVFNPNLHMTQVRYDAPNTRWFIEALNSDGAGGYYVIWVFERGEYKKRFMYYGF